jgi:hypothetical protein
MEGLLFDTPDGSFFSFKFLEFVSSNWIPLSKNSTIGIVFMGFFLFIGKRIKVLHLDALHYDGRFDFFMSVS